MTYYLSCSNRGIIWDPAECGDVLAVDEIVDLHDVLMIEGETKSFTPINMQILPPTKHEAVGPRRRCGESLCPAQCIP